MKLDNDLYVKHLQGMIKYPTVSLSLIHISRWMPGSGKTPISRQRRSTARPTLPFGPLTILGR